MKIKKSYILWYSMLVILLCAIFYISWIIWFIKSIINIILYSIFFYFLYFLWKKFRNKKYLDFINFLPLFIYKFCLFIYSILLLIFVFVYYNNYLYPASMPQYAITNWNKIIIFQSMIHIANKNFYENVRKDLKEFKANSWVLFYEWVKVDNEESLKKFNQALWLDFSPDLYKNLSELYWVSFQNNDDFLWIINDSDFNIDLDISRIIQIYEEKIKSKSKQTKNLEFIDISSEINKYLTYLTQREKILMLEINKALLNFVIKNNSIILNNIDSIWNPELFNVILDERNKNLVNELIESNHSKIFVLYWAMHFDWIYKLLKENNNNWTIIDTKLLYPMK